jgi:hypothetical protein
MELRSGQGPESAEIVLQSVYTERGEYPGPRTWSTSLPEVRAGRERAWSDILAVLEEYRRGTPGADVFDAANIRLATSVPAHPLKELMRESLRRAGWRVLHSRGDAGPELDRLIREVRKAPGQKPQEP